MRGEGGGAVGGAGVVKVSRQQSKGVKCLSCLFTVNDGFDSLPKEQWEIRSEGHALGYMEDNAAGFVTMRAVLWANGEIFMQVCICVYVNFSFLLFFSVAAEALWSIWRGRNNTCR